jgi:hypothetical protein
LIAIASFRPSARQRDGAELQERIEEFAETGSTANTDRKKRLKQAIKVSVDRVRRQIYPIVHDEFGLPSMVTPHELSFDDDTGCLMLLFPDEPRARNRRQEIEAILNSGLKRVSAKATFHGIRPLKLAARMTSYGLRPGTIRLVDNGLAFLIQMQAVSAAATPPKQQNSSKKEARLAVNAPPVTPSTETSAQVVRTKEEYFALAAAPYGPSDSAYWSNVNAALPILRAGGAAAVEAILEQISAHRRCAFKLAEVLVEIGDPRAVPVLKKALLAKDFSGTPGVESAASRFVAKFDPSIEEEQRLARAKEDAADDARFMKRLTAASPATGMLREYAYAYIFEPAARARSAYGALQTAMRRGIAFPLDVPYQIGLVHGPAADFVAVVFRLPIADDESVASHRRIKTWLAQNGAGDFDDWEGLWAPPAGQLSRGLRASFSTQYSLLDLIDTL